MAPQEQLYHLGVKAIIQNAQGQVLMLKRAGGAFWDLPGGRVQIDENLPDTLIREVKEETGIIDLQHIQSVGDLVVTPIAIPITIGNITIAAKLLLRYYTCFVAHPHITLSDEHSEFLWVDWHIAQTHIRFIDQLSNVHFHINPNRFSEIERTML